jgi:hypothetical protein
MMRWSSFAWIARCRSQQAERSWTLFWIGPSENIASPAGYWPVMKCFQTRARLEFLLPMEEKRIVTYTCHPTRPTHDNSRTLSPCWALWVQWLYLWGNLESKQERWNRWGVKTWSSGPGLRWKAEWIAILWRGKVWSGTIQHERDNFPIIHESVALSLWWLW